MALTERTLWALAVAEYPVVDAHDYDAVHRTFGPAFGPWLPVAVRHGSGAVTVLAVGGNTDPVRALTAVVGEWARCPEAPTAGDVAREAPQGLLLRHGLARLAGEVVGIDIPGDLPLR
ncbi:hypothetical protein SAMN05660657_02317 [Geodermatophilus amargosae]|uniref:Uncharacterized protein n=1 Tax=Geodermatophilus amargosae TaxID=1296565 RepID=A0A1I6ZX21_9ACTN|nr:hypothetical protein [Geodermatophilus amargosae]SFT67201.1 hypothetical protein SAMN05660657_02317 [Geodermatophilus amargosae]